jgi:hypothetical protein
MEEVLLLTSLSLAQAEKRSFGLPQAGRLTTIVVGTTGQLRAGVIRMNRVGIAVRFVGVGNGA